MPRRTHFGYRQVPLCGQAGAGRDGYSTASPRVYDLMNDLMSAACIARWKDVLPTPSIPPKGSRPFKLLDVAGARRHCVAGGAGGRHRTHATVLDINAHMLAVAGARRSIGATTTR